MPDQVSFVWHKAADRRVRSPQAFAIITGLMTIVFVLAVVFRDYWMAGWAVAFMVTGIPAVLAPRPRVRIEVRTVVVAQKRWFIHSHRLFPTMMTVAGMCVTVQALVGSPTSTNVRLPYLAALSWLLVAMTFFHAFRNRGSLTLNGQTVAIAGRFSSAASDLSVSVVQIRKLAFPQLELASPMRGATKQTIFPTMCFGLEANSVYSTLRHLAETDEEIRRDYGPELIREMLLFTPDRQVAVGESIEVRIVAKSEAHSA